MATTPTAAATSAAALFAELAGQVKDGKAAALVARVQSQFETIQAACLQAEQQRLELQQEVIRLEAELSELKRIQGRITSAASGAEKMMIPHDSSDPDVGPPGTLL